MTGGDRRAKRRWWSEATSLLVVAFVLLAACSSDPPVLTADPDRAPATTSAPLGSTTDATPVAVSGDVGEAEAAWLGLWAGAEQIVTEPERARSEITAVATQAVYEQVEVLFNPSVEGFDNNPKSFENYPVVTEQPDGSVVVDDCVFETPRVGNKTVWYRGTLSSTGGGWQVDSLEVVNLIGCVPSEIAEAAFAGYDAYWDARLEFWDPADPDHPLVEQTMTGMHLDLIRGLLQEDQTNGWALRGRHTSHYEIIEVRSQADVAIRDCLDQDPDRGVYDIETGERLDDELAPIVEGQRDFLSAVMLLEDGVWKVSDVQAQRQTACEYPPSAQGLPIV